MPAVPPSATAGGVTRQRGPGRDKLRIRDQADTPTSCSGAVGAHGRTSPIPRRASPTRSRRRGGPGTRQTVTPEGLEPEEGPGGWAKHLANDGDGTCSTLAASGIIIRVDFSTRESFGLLTRPAGPNLGGPGSETSGPGPQWWLRRGSVPDQIRVQMAFVFKFRVGTRAPRRPPERGVPRPGAVSRSARARVFGTRAPGTQTPSRHFPSGGMFKFQSRRTRWQGRRQAARSGPTRNRDCSRAGAPSSGPGLLHE